MRERIRNHVHGLLIVPLALVLGGCGAAAVGAAGAAGAAGAIAYSERGAESHVDADIGTVASATESAFAALGIAVEERRAEAHENEIEIKGDQGNDKIVVDIEGDRDAGRTHIEVTVSENLVDYDRSRAEEILAAILDRL